MLFWACPLEMPESAFVEPPPIKYDHRGREIHTEDKDKGKS